jgi:uncharacterized membrane protein YhfC
MILLFASPVILGLWLNRRLGLSWMLFFGGALAFTVSWILTGFILLPPQIELLVVSIVQIGILYLVYRYLLPTVRKDREALMVGLGQGGIELIILVVFLVLPSFTQMLAIRDATDDELISVAARREDIAEEEVQPSHIDDLRQDIDEYWSTPWYEVLLQALPSLAALPIQMALAVIVLGSLTQRDYRVLIGAMALHFLSKSIPIYAGIVGDIVFWLIVTLLFGGIAVWFLRRLWPTIMTQTSAALAEREKAKKRAKHTS